MSVDSMSSIHPTAIIAEGAQLGADCQVGPYCVIGPNVVLGDSCRLHSHVVIDGYTTLGQGNEVFPFATLGAKTQDLKWEGGIQRVRIGDRNTFREYVSVNAATADGGETVIGSHNHILAYCHVAHDCRLGDRIIMSNVATLAGHVTVDDHAVIGGLAAVHQFCRIGRNAIIGGCSKVIQDVVPFMMIDGNPAKTRAVNKEGMRRKGISEAAQVAVKQAFKLLFRENLSVPNALARVEGEVEMLPEVKYLIGFIRESKRGIA